MSLATNAFTILGANISELEVTPTGTGSGRIVPSVKVGSRVQGDSGSAFLFCKLTLAAVTSLLDGHVFTIDKDFNASLITTANSPRGQKVGVGRLAAPATPVGVYYLWLQVDGVTPVQVVATTPVAFTPMETTATAGVLGAPASATASTKLVAGAVLTAANAGAAGAVEAILNWPVTDKTN